MTQIILHTVRLGVDGVGGYHPDAWLPRVRLTLVGPTPAAAELVWRVARPDGDPWFERSAHLAELAADQSIEIVLGADDPALDIPGFDAPGKAPFSLRVVSALDDVDELLLHGSVTVVELGENRFAVDDQWMPGAALLALDTVDEPDAPRLTVTALLGGDIEDHTLEAHCFLDGRRLARADTVVGRHAFVTTDGDTVGLEVEAVFGDVRGWNNLAESGWGGDWHLLDTASGAYEVKFVASSEVARVVPFTVEDGRLVAPGPVELDPRTGAVVFAYADIPDQGAPGAWTSLDEIYRQRVSPAKSSGGVVGSGGGSGSGSTGGVVGGTGSGGTGSGGSGSERSVDAGSLDHATSTALTAYVDRVERLLATWEADLIGTSPPFDASQGLAAEAVLREVESYGELRDAVSAVPAEHAVSFGDEASTIGTLDPRVEAVFAAAATRLTSAAHDDEAGLAPFRALLRGDKLTVFEEHPANTFVYTTTGRRVIETPEELASAEYWYFEGPVDLTATATVGGETVDIRVQGWRVCGWQFDENGMTVDEWESEGQGSSAPKSVYQPDRR